MLLPGCCFPTVLLVLELLLLLLRRMSLVGYCCGRWFAAVLRVLLFMLLLFSCGCWFVAA